MISANSALPPLTEGPGSHGNPYKMTQGMDPRQVNSQEHPSIIAQV